MITAFVVFSHIILLYCNAMYIIVGAERDDFFIWGDVVDNAPTDSVNVEVVGVHECHAAKQKDSSSNFAQ